MLGSRRGTTVGKLSLLVDVLDRDFPFGGGRVLATKPKFA